MFLKRPNQIRFCQKVAVYSHKTNIIQPITMEPQQQLRQKRPLDEPGSFALTRSCPSHNSERCFHRFVLPPDSFQNREDKATACATAHIVHSVSNSFGRWEGAGTKPAAHILGKAVALQTVIDPELPEGLNQATARALGTKATMVAYGRDVRARKSDTVMNEELVNGVYGARKTRADRYDRRHVYNYFHHEGSLPDFCTLVEPNKNVRTKWKHKSWDLDGENMILTCEMKLRKGTLKELAQDYLDSETHAG
jgi:hypothetical protein